MGSGVLYIVGICGIGMSGIAQVLKHQGYTVQGSDSAPGAMGSILAASGIAVVNDLQYIESADMVVYSNAIPEKHPELEYARKLGKPLLKRWEIVRFLLKDKEVIVVSGCHGKTSTTAMIGEILVNAGRDPTILCGGIMNKFGNNVRLGRSNLYVVEGDESDDTFYLLPRDFAVVTNIGDDHLEYHGSSAALQAKFLNFVNASKGIFPRLELFSSVEGFQYDYDPQSCIPRLSNVKAEGLKMYFQYKVDGDHQFILNAPGLFNVNNAMAAIACTYSYGIDMEVIKHSLKEYAGVNRRMTLIGEILGQDVYSDYAHHPDEIIATSKAMEHLGEVTLVIQPHRYSRVSAFFEEYSSFWKVAHAVVFLDVYSAGEEENGYDSGKLLRKAREEGGKNVFYAGDEQEIYNKLVEINLKRGIIIFMGAGNVDRIARRIVDFCKVLELKN